MDDINVEFNYLSFGLVFEDFGKGYGVRLRRELVINYITVV